MHNPCINYTLTLSCSSEAAFNARLTQRLLILWCQLVHLKSYNYEKNGTLRSFFPVDFHNRR